VAAVYPILSAAYEEALGAGTILLSIFRGLANLLPVADEFIAYCILFLSLAFLAFIARFVYIRYRVKFSARIVERNQNEVFNRIIRADYQFFTEHRQGELIYNTVRAPEQLSGLINQSAELLSRAVMSISMLLILFSLSWQGALAVVGLGVVYQSLSRYLGRKVSYHAGMGEMEATKDSNVILNETISGIRQVKVFTITEDWAHRFAEAAKRRWHHFARRTIWQEIPAPSLILIMYLFIGGAALLIRTLVPASFTELIPVFGTFAFAVFRIVPAISAIGRGIMGIMGAIPSCEVVYHALNTKFSHIQDGETELDSFKSEIEFKNVTFGYDGRKEILKDISVTLEKGKTTAIVGRSGSGKTTIINLILRLFDIDSGEVRIDGLNIKEYKLGAWLNKIGVVSQDTFTFNDSVKNNITLRLNYSDGEIVRAAEYADAHSFITELLNGYDTFVGDRGMRLSGGQKQRIAVARAVIREPDILIFDEATNALDSISEAAVQKAIDEVSRDHTVIVVAHRLSTIANADKIIVLGNGRVLEEGTHKELMENRGHYWELYRTQPV